MRLTTTEPGLQPKLAQELEFTAMPKQVWEEVTSVEVPHKRLITTPLKQGASLQVSKRYRIEEPSPTYGTVL